MSKITTIYSEIQLLLKECSIAHGNVYVWICTWNLLQIISLYNTICNNSWVFKWSHLGQRLQMV